MTNIIPHNNFVGQLQEICSKFKLNKPEYCDDSVVTSSQQFRCTCRVGKWSSSGSGYSKKAAKQMAAQEIVKIIENENLQVVKEEKSLSDDAISKLAIYGMKENLEPPLYSEKPKEDSLFVIECTFEGFSAIGKGWNKKIAKEAAAEFVATHFKVYEYCANLKKTDARRKSLKNPVSNLNELCQTRRLQLTFTDKKLPSGKVDKYVVSCQVGEKTTESSVHSSQKNAKMEAAQLMCNILNGQATEASPVTPPLSEVGELSDEDRIVSVKRNQPAIHHSSSTTVTTDRDETSENSSDDEPPVKKVLLV